MANRVQIEPNDFELHAEGYPFFGIITDIEIQNREGKYGPYNLAIFTVQNACGGGTLKDGRPAIVKTARALPGRWNPKNECVKLIRSFHPEMNSPEHFFDFDLDEMVLHRYLKYMVVHERGKGQHEGKIFDNVDKMEAATQEEVDTLNVPPAELPHPKPRGSMAFSSENLPDDGLPF
jgi:hypothetical protein